MAYEYKTILSRQGYDFDYYKNRYNSKLSGVIAVDKKTDGVINVATVNNKTGTISITDYAATVFSKKTIADLKTKISL